jgi:polysaccharide pyruvyl transferase WcaK-like protein
VTTKLPILVRDPVSYERFVQNVRLKNGHAATLVADIAFNLKPRITPRVQTELDWMAEQRAAGHFVLGFNLHTMLVKKASLPSLIETTIAQLRGFMAAHPQVALALVPHDYRAGGGAGVLKQIAEALASGGGRVRLVTPVFSAEELKALTGGLDVLFTSRMHLGIAALGMGKPISAFAYQGKFVGLFRHVGLPEELILSPENADGLAKTLGALVRDVAALTQAVAKALPATMDLAKKNLLP